MAFTPTNFLDLPATTTPITGAELNKLGTQYGSAVAQMPAEVAATLSDETSDSWEALDTATASHITTSGTSATKSALAQSFLKQTIIYPGIAGVVGDGVTDDTGAIQALIDATPRGSTVMFTRPMSGSAWIISGNLQVTTSQLRFASNTRDSYAINLTKPSGTGAIVTVKESGFMADGVQFIGDGTLDRGEGATITGVDFYGTAAGDIDAYVTDCSFYHLAVGVRVRSRNIRIGENLFSNSLNGVMVEGRDTSFHTTAANTVRGILIDSNRFHSMGFSATDASVEFKDTLLDFRHAQVDSNYFDTFGNGRGIVATGTAATPLKSLTMRGNKHQDIRAAAYELTYCNDFVLDPTIINGSGDPACDFDGIVLRNCAVGVVINPFIMRVGRSGIKGTNNYAIRVLNPVVQLSALASASTGHGLDFDSTNSHCRFINPTVNGVDGYGFNGSPTDSSLSGGQFRNCTLGSISSTTLVGASVFKSGSGFARITGSPVNSSINSYACMLLDPTSLEQVSDFIGYPSDWISYSIEVWWLSTSDSPGNVRFQVAYTDPISGEPISGGGFTTATPSVTTGVSNRVHKFTAYPNVAATATNAVGIRVIRLGDHAADTYSYDVGLIGVRLVRLI